MILNKKIVIVGSYNKDYSRNKVLISALRKFYNVEEININRETAPSSFKLLKNLINLQEPSFKKNAILFHNSNDYTLILR